MTKKPRVAWTPDLHARFVKAVTALGVDTAVPKQIMLVRSVSLTRHRCHHVLPMSISCETCFSPVDLGSAWSWLFPLGRGGIVTSSTLRLGCFLQAMNVEGLTRENVASHLQKFRLQLRRDKD